MLKKLSLLTIIFFIGFVNNTFAHTGLESSIPQNGQVIKEELKQITLNFETKVEQNSTFELKYSNGDTIPVENITLSEFQMVGSLINPLENGTYQINWKIIGADGHPIEGELSFSVDVPVSETAPENTEEPQSQPDDAANTENTETRIETEQEDVQQNKLPSYVIPSIIGILIVIVIGSFLLILKRKK
ncbi:MULTISPECIES: copper resistance protein CopC [Robertmurraya]|uniref:Copper resistance protein CopC n=1 Tax=Robertmurraya beringensis TaxID=641660 RepID=A0ABV6L003_9BACI